MTDASRASILSPSTRSGLTSSDSRPSPSRSASRAMPRIADASAFPVRGLGAADAVEQGTATQLGEHLADVRIVDRQGPQGGVVEDMDKDAAETHGQGEPPLLVTRDPDDQLDPT